MKIGTNLIAQTYKSENKKIVDKKETNSEKKASGDYIVELSSKGKEILEKSKSKDYDMSEIMRIHEKGFKEIPTKEESEYYHNARRNDPALDSYLYEMDKAEAMKDMGKVQTILMKAVTGEKLTPEEEEMLKEDSALQQEFAKKKAEADLYKQTTVVKKTKNP